MVVGIHHKNPCSPHIETSNGRTARSKERAGNGKQVRVVPADGRLPTTDCCCWLSDVARSRCAILAESQKCLSKEW